MPSKLRRPLCQSDTVRDRAETGPRFGGETMKAQGKFVRTALVAALALVAFATFTSASGGSAPTPQSVARQMLSQPSGRFLTAPARTALTMLANGDNRFGTPTTLGGEPAAAPTQAVTATSTLHLRSAARAITANVRVNNPATDSLIDQTTQSETTIAVSGKHVVVGFNDSQQALLLLTAGADLTGYSYSADGGTTWTDGGTLPNRRGTVNVGDPWLAGTPDGTFFYSTLMLDPASGLAVGVARSTNGGRTWTAPVQVSPNPGNSGFADGDKPALTSGPTPDGGTALYDAWDDFSCGVTGCFSGLPVSRSTDGGLTWQVTYADQRPTGKGCSFAQYIGAQPLVDPANGTLYVASEKISAVDPNCIGAPVTFSEVLFTSTDAGQSFSGPKRIADVTPAEPSGALKVGTGQYMRTIEFPSIALRDGVMYVAWNDGRLTGHSHVMLATSGNGGASWNLRFVTQGTSDELQPALTADAAGLHLLYYQWTAGSLDVYEADATDVASWAVQKVNSQSSPGVFTSPQFDPIIAPGYMGDYIANVTDGVNHYFSWADNRDVVKNLLWPRGRHDPDVFFSRG